MDYCITHINFLMNVIVFIFLSGVSSSGISNSEPSMGELPDVISLDEDNHEEQDMANNPATHHEGEKNSNDIPANEKTGNYYKDIKQSIKGTTVSMDDKDQLLQPIPGSDVNATNEEEYQSYLQNLKLRLMLGIALMALLISISLVISFIATLYKLKQLSHKRSQSQYSINPELAMLSYFHPSEGVSDTSFSKSAESSTYWSGAHLDLRKQSSRMSRNITALDDIGLHEESELLISEEANEEISDVSSENPNEEINDVK
ncbi:Acrosome formation-associated factor [Fukomys damarensis]|uniref:Acrosome formation-associated factor n=1 Tax=Fukomys damarensis TaxID=885580 RepID=A0A091EA23_FUKDA|nr:Acrosome formation-associated factor [Fukomys damarensis]